MTHHSRRDFMRLTCCSAATAAMVSGLSKFGLVSALAQASTDYKALVCIFLFGGNDANNLVVPIDTAGYTNYQTIRANLALAQASLLPLQIGGQANFGLHPNLPDLQTLFNATKSPLALLTNVGTLVQPTTRQNYQSHASLPENLFSHSDQQEQWQTTQLSGLPNAGWAGKVADKIQAMNSGAQFPPILSVAGSSIFCTGDTTRPFTMSPGSTPGLSGFSTSAASQARFLSTQQLLTFDTGISLVQAASAVTGQAIQEGVVLAAALKNIPAIQTVFPASNGLASQLKQVAQVIAARSALNVQRQIFFCSLGGFDTHSDQLDIAGQPLHTVEPGYGCFLSGHARARRLQRSDHLHALRIQPDIPAGLQRRNGPRLGRPSDDHGRRRERKCVLRSISHADSRRTGRHRKQRPVDSLDIRGPIRRDTRHLVRSRKHGSAIHLPEPRQLSIVKSGISRLEEFRSAGHTSRRRILRLDAFLCEMF